MGLGSALLTAGPVGALLGFTFTGVLVSGVVLSIAELAALVPLTGSYVRHAEYFFDPAWSFAIGWNQVYGACVALVTLTLSFDSNFLTLSPISSIPAEITAAAVLISFWTTSVSNGVWITIMGILIISTNMFFIRVYGEVEFTFAILKIMLIVGLIIMVRSYNTSRSSRSELFFLYQGLCIDLGGVPGQHRLGFQYWRNPVRNLYPLLFTCILNTFDTGSFRPVPRYPRISWPFPRVLENLL